MNHQISANQVLTSLSTRDVGRVFSIRDATSDRGKALATLQELTRALAAHPKEFFGLCKGNGELKFIRTTLGDRRLLKALGRGNIAGRQLPVAEDNNTSVMIGKTWSHNYGPCAAFSHGRPLNGAYL